MTIKEKCRVEILRIHKVIEDWMVGRQNQTVSEFAQFTNAIAEDFRLITPSGNMQGKAAVEEEIWKDYGIESEPFCIEIRNYDCRFVTDTLCVATYEEWHYSGSITARLSTVLLRDSPNFDGGLQWIHLHETWLPCNSEVCDEKSGI